MDEPRIEQIRAMLIKSAWDTARTELKLPAGWGPKLIRHSMATILLNRRVDFVELEIALGHRRIDSVTDLYAAFDPAYLADCTRALERLIDEIEALAPGAFHRKDTGGGATIIPMRA